MNDRQNILKMIDEAVDQGARLSKACEVLGLSARSTQRWRHNLIDRRETVAQHRSPANKLTDQERDQILSICNQGSFASMSPNQIVPALADQGAYVASESSFYRVLNAAKQLKHRGKAKAATHKRPKAIEASEPNQVWSWDITYLPSTVKGMFFYLYMIMDIYSRKIVGWEVYGTESADNAALLIRKTCLKEKIATNPLVLHSDNGSPMKAATMLSTLQRLGVMPSFSRPSVSNDNPYSEALFKTLKYHPGYPEAPFESIQAARKWVMGFNHWYNEVHRHSAIKFVTPAQRHCKQDVHILQRRTKLYLAARKKYPQRWSGKIRNWQPATVVYLNPKRSDEKSRKAA